MPRTGCTCHFEVGLKLSTSVLKGRAVLSYSHHHHTAVRSELRAGVSKRTPISSNRHQHHLTVSAEFGGNILECLPMAPQGCKHHSVVGPELRGRKLKGLAMSRHRNKNHLAVRLQLGRGAAQRATILSYSSEDYLTVGPRARRSGLHPPTKPTTVPDHLEKARVLQWPANQSEVYNCGLVTQAGEVAVRPQLQDSADKALRFPRSSCLDFDGSLQITDT